MDLINRRVLVTGGTGSFGKTVSKYLLEKGAIVRIYSRDEEKQWSMRDEFGADANLEFRIGDVRDAERVSHEMRGVDYVFHAAALKQVPFCEQHPHEAYKTNVQGTHNVCQAAIQHNVKRVVFLSTDKAVKPINAMGISKSMAEKIVCSYNADFCATTFACVRYGNVLGTRGSIVPFMRSRIEKKLPLVITEPRMTRFLMTLPQAVSLVLMAFNDASGGEVFVQKAPASTIATLVDAVKVLYAGNDYPVQYSGPRPGEKMHEVLVSEHEVINAAESSSHFVICPQWRPHIYSNRPNGEYTSQTTQQLELEEVISLLKTL